MAVLFMLARRRHGCRHRSCFAAFCCRRLLFHRLEPTQNAKSQEDHEHGYEHNERCDLYKGRKQERLFARVYNKTFIIEKKI